MTGGTSVLEKTARPDHWVTAFEALLAGDAAGPEWLVQRRRAAWAEFAESGFPTTHQEAWRFTSVEPIAKGTFVAPTAASVEPARLDPFLVGAEGRITAVVVNGRFDSALSQTADLPEGVVVRSLAEALRAGDPVVEAHLGRYTEMSENPFARLNTAFMTDGVFVHVGRNVSLDRPIQVIYVTTGGTPTVTHPRTLVVAEPGSTAEVIETYAGLDDVAYWTNAATEVAVGEDANIATCRIQRESERAFQTAITQSSQERASIYAIVAVVLGAALSRHDINAVLNGPGAEATLNGLSILRDRQHADHHTTIEHAQPHCNSWEYFNGIYDDRSHGVFNGRIVVRPGAQRTDSKQTNNNLLLTEDARADSQPQLEIYADDVKCTHGATLGPMDPRAVFYLRSRGLDEAAARSLLTYGFGVEILAYVTDDALREQLDEVIHARLEEGARRRGAAA
jgi:Fe-S cluster assembly protein SufD